MSAPNEHPSEGWRPDILAMVDASGGGWLDVDRLAGVRAGALTRRDEATGAPTFEEVGVGQFDPFNWRLHDLRRVTPSGLADRRMAVALVSDHDAPTGSPEDGEAPFGQAEWHTARDRSTRVVDPARRSALLTSALRITDTEDQRYGLALPVRSAPLGLARVATPPTFELPPGVSLLEAGASTGTGGTVSRSLPSVVVDGRTYFGQAARDAGEAALRAGEGKAGIENAARAKVGLPAVPVSEAERAATQERKAQLARRGVPETAERRPATERPDACVRQGGAAGLLWTFFTPEGAGGHDYEGREGTRIGPLPARHDAQFAMDADGPRASSGGFVPLGKRFQVDADGNPVLGPDGKPVAAKVRLVSADSDTALGVLPEGAPLGGELVSTETVKSLVSNYAASRYGAPADTVKEAEQRLRYEQSILAALGRATDPEALTAAVSYRGLFPLGSSGNADLANAVDAVLRETPTFKYGSAAEIEKRRAQIAAELERGKEARYDPVRRELAAHAALREAAATLRLDADAAEAAAKAARASGKEADARTHDGKAAQARAAAQFLEGGPRALPTTGKLVGRIRFAANDAASVPANEAGRPVKGELWADTAAAGEGSLVGHETCQWVPVIRLNAEIPASAPPPPTVTKVGPVRDPDDPPPPPPPPPPPEPAPPDGPGSADQSRAYDDGVLRHGLGGGEHFDSDLRDPHFNGVDGVPCPNATAPTSADGETITDTAHVLDSGGRPIGPATVGAPGASDPGWTSVQATPAGIQVGLGQGAVVVDTVPGASAVALAAENRNAASFRVPFLGEPGGPTTVQDWVYLATIALRAQQEITHAAFGGPEHLEANVALVHRNRGGAPPAPSLIGAHWASRDGESLEVPTDRSAVELFSVLDATAGGSVVARAERVDSSAAVGGGVVGITRVTLGGSVTDDRPLLLLDNDRGARDQVDAPMISDVGQTFVVDSTGAITTPSVTTSRLESQETGTDTATFEFTDTSGIVAAAFDVDAADVVNVLWLGDPDGRDAPRQSYVSPEDAVGVADTVGGPLIVQGGRSTGSASGGALFFQVSPPGAAGTTQNEQTDRLVIGAAGATFYDSDGSTELFKVDIATNKVYANGNEVTTLVNNPVQSSGANVLFNDAAYTTMILGATDTSATAPTGTLRGVNGTGTNKTGAIVALQGGLGTGDGEPGRLDLKASSFVGSGSTLQTATTRLRVGRAATSFFQADGSTKLLDLDTTTGAPKIGFFGTAAAARPTVTAALTDNSGGTANTTIEAMPDPADTPITADQLRDDLVANFMPAVRNNIADLTAIANSLRSALTTLGIAV